MKDINKSNEIYEQRMDLKRRFLRVFKKSSWPEFIELFNKNLDRKAAESDPILMKIYEYFFGIAFFCCKKLDSPDETLQSVLQQAFNMLLVFINRSKRKVKDHQGLIENIESGLLKAIMTLTNGIIDRKPSLIQEFYDLKQKETVIRTLLITYQSPKIQREAKNGLCLLMNIPFVDGIERCCNFYFDFFFKKTLPALMQEDGKQHNYMNFFQFGA